MARRVVVLSLGLVVLGGAFFGIVFATAQGHVYRDPGSTVLTCSDRTPIPEPAPDSITDFEDLDPRHRPAFVRATQQQFADVTPETARYYETNGVVRYQGAVYHCETSGR